MFRIFNWNARGLGSSVKRRFLRDTLFNNKIDLVGIQETKKDSFTERTLHSFSSTITHWVC